MTENEKKKSFWCFFRFNPSCMCLIGMFASASRRSLPLHQTLLDLFEGGKQTWPFTRTSKNSLLFYFFSFLDFGNTEIIQTYGTFNYNCTSVVQNNHNLPTFYQFSPNQRPEQSQKRKSRQFESMRGCAKSSYVNIH